MGALRTARWVWGKRQNVAAAYECASAKHKRTQSSVGNQLGYGLARYAAQARSLGLTDPL